jgi:hypothetical protein
MTETMPPKVWTREMVLNLLARSDTAVVRALQTLYARQTADEQQDKTTRVRNGRGFNARDAAVLTDIAQKLPRYDNRMTERQLALVRGRIRKYAGQLLDEVEAKGGLVDRRAHISVTDDDLDDWPDVDRLVEQAIENANDEYASREQAIEDRARFGVWA